MEYLALCALQFESAFAHRNLTLYISNPHSPKKIQSFALQIHIRPRKLGKGAGNVVHPPEIFTNVVCRSENNEKSRVHPPSFLKVAKFSLVSFLCEVFHSKIPWAEFECVYMILILIRWHREYCRVYFVFFHSLFFCYLKYLPFMGSFGSRFRLKGNDL